MLQMKFDAHQANCVNAYSYLLKEKCKKNTSICYKKKYSESIIISANKNIAEAFSCKIICHTTVWKQLIKFRYKINHPINSFLVTRDHDV